jgi:hypothetical protein
MSLKNNIDEQRKYLERNLEQLNTVVSAVLGYRTHLEIIEKTNNRGTYFKVIDNRNIRDKCGVMAKAFTEVTISNFGIWWSDEGVCFYLHFNYVHIGGGSTGAEFCRIDIVNDFVQIR